MKAARRTTVLLLAAATAAGYAAAFAGPARAQEAAPDFFLVPLLGGGVAAFPKPAPLPPAPVPPPQPVALQIPSPPILHFNAHQPRPRTPYGDLIYKAARRHAVNPQVVAAVIQAESDFQPGAKSRAGACGLMQLLPETARRFGLMKKRDLFKPAKNIEAGVRYLRWLTERFGDDLSRVVAAYNAGEGAVDRFGGVPPFSETLGYVRRIYGTLGFSSLVSAVLPPTPERVFPVALAPALPVAALAPISGGLVEAGH
ncbi:MAG TPA: lytic transglycosylase domain-containing protein [Thermoanaerobaculia bacterium]|nr:lytic transglycosylase domain-containing protein [Thermoanaerobaculia bacterium]